MISQSSICKLVFISRNLINRQRYFNQLSHESIDVEASLRRTMLWNMLWPSAYQSSHNCNCVVHLVFTVHQCFRIIIVSNRRRKWFFGRLFDSVWFCQPTLLCKIGKDWNFICWWCAYSQKVYGDANSLYITMQQSTVLLDDVLREHKNSFNLRRLSQKLNKTQFTKVLNN